MSPARILFSGQDAGGHTGLWVTDGTVPGTSEIAVTGAGSNGINPFDLTVLGSKILFSGQDAAGNFGLWITDGTTGGTSEITVPGAATTGAFPSNFTVIGAKAVFTGSIGGTEGGLWVTNGTNAGTSQLQISGANFGVTAVDLTAFGSKVLFGAFVPTDAFSSVGPINLYVTDGTTAGTSLLTVTGAATGLSGFDPQQLTVLGSRVLFGGLDASSHFQLWSTDGTGPGTTELAVSGANANGLSPLQLTPFGSDLLFSGRDSAGNTGLWITDGTAAHTSEIPVSGASGNGVNPSSFAVLGAKAVFDGRDAGGLDGLWITDGTGGGTSELAVAGASASFGLSPGHFTPFAGKMLFTGFDTANTNGLWITDGTAAGTSEIVAANASSSGLDPAGLFVDGTHVLFNGTDAAGHEGLWETDGTAAGTTELAVTGAAAGGLFPAGFTALPCYRRGTLLRTVRGEVAVEHLAIGDRVVTISGEHRPVVWIGHRRVDCRNHPQPEKILPVRVRAGAFAAGKPRRDLYLSPDHAVFAAGDAEGSAPGVLIPIRLLINGTTIAQVAAEQVTYYHVELASHDVVFAEDLPAETYLETGNRDCFDSGGGAVRLHPAFEPEAAFGDVVWEVLGCAPLVVVGPELDRVRRRLTRIARKFAAAAAQPRQRRIA